MSRDEQATRLAGGVDRTLDGAVLVLAAWTVVYHLSLLTGLGSTPALAVTAVILGLLGAARWVRPAGVRGPVTETASSTRTSYRIPTRVLAGVTVVVALASATAMALDVAWSLVWPTWLLAAVTGTWAAARRVGEPIPSSDQTNEPGSAWFALACALVLAAFATIILRPNPDDLFYVNLSQWVADTGDFPLRDTIYSNLDLPLANWPPLASYDGLTGAVAHVAGVRAGDVVYVVVPPIVTALSVLALWRLLRAWRVRHVVVALSAALLFLLLDGTESYASPGNLFVTRMWQGKVILLCLLVPTVLTYAVRFAQRPNRGTATWLAVGGVAAVGCSTTAAFLMPVVAVAVAAPLVAVRQPRAAVGGFLALAAYPLAAAAVTLALGGRSADDFGERRQYRFDPAWFGHEVFLTGVIALVAVSAVLLATVLLPHPGARVTTGVLLVSIGVVLVPGVTEWSYDVVGLGPTLWRLTWSLTVAALVGVLAAWLWQRAPARGYAWAGAGVAVAVLATTGAPIWSAETSTSLHMPPHWQRSRGALDVADWAIRRAGPEGRVLAPDGLAVTVAVRTTQVKTVAPRDYYLTYLEEEAGFQYEDRLLLVEFVNRVPNRREDVFEALRALRVDVACAYTSDLRGIALLEAFGYEVGHRDETYVCLVPRRHANTG